MVLKWIAGHPLVETPEKETEKDEDGLSDILIPGDEEYPRRRRKKWARSIFANLWITLQSIFRICKRIQFAIDRKCAISLFYSVQSNLKFLGNLLGFNRDEYDLLTSFFNIIAEK